MEIDEWGLQIDRWGGSLSAVAGDDCYCEKFDFWKGMCGQMRRLQVNDEQSDVV